MAAEDRPVLDPGGDIDSVTGLAQQRLLLLAWMLNTASPHATWAYS
jgi:hypothetical protein